MALLIRSLILCPRILFIVLAFAFVESKSQSLFTIGMEAAPQGARALIPVEMQSDPSPVAIQMDMMFNENIVLSEPTLRGNSSSGHEMASRLLAPGRRRIVIYSESNTAIPDGLIIDAPFQILPGAPSGLSQLQLQNVIAADSLAEQLGSISVTAGGIQVIEGGNGPTLRGFSVSVDGVFGFELNVLDGAEYRIEVSEDLQAWEELETITANGETLQFTDPDSPNLQKRFYRAIQIQP